MARILVINEDAASNALIAGTLGSWGHEVESAADGGKASVRLAECHFDLIVTDMARPAMDCIEFVNWSPGGTRPRILALSDHGSEDASRLLLIAMLLGADASLRKPFTPEELRDVVTALLDDKAAA